VLLALSFVVITIAGIIYLINFSQIVANIPLGSRYAQINIEHKSVNIFTPRMIIPGYTPIILDLSKSLPLQIPHVKI